MTRLLALNALFFLAPFAIYAGWLWASQGAPGKARDWTLKVVLGLCAAGAVLMLIGLVALTTFSGAQPGSVYHPAVVRDGRIVPGGFVPATPPAPAAPSPAAPLAPPP